MDCNNIFTPIEIDAIGEILNISLGASATAISTMLNTRVDITTPRVRIVTDEEFSFEELKPVIGVEITYISGLEGKNIMLLKRGDVKLIVELLMGVEIADDEFELDEMNLSAVCEVMNQMMGASATALSEFLNKTVNISTPVSFELHSEEEFKKKYFVQAQPMVVVNFVLSIDNKLKSEFVNVVSVDLAKKLLNVFLPPEYREDEDTNIEENFPEESPAVEMPQASTAPSQDIDITPAVSTPQATAAAIPQVTDVQPSMGGHSAANMSQVAGIPPTASGPEPASAALEQQMQQLMMMIQNMQQVVQPPANKIINTRPVSYNPLEKAGTGKEAQEENLDLLMGVSLEISVEIGRTQGMVKDILEYTKGTLVVLDKLAGDPVDLYVNGRCIARGDVVVIDDNFGIRISEILRNPEGE